MHNMPKRETWILTCEKGCLINPNILFTRWHYHNMTSMLFVQQETSQLIIKDIQGLHRTVRQHIVRMILPYILPLSFLCLPLFV